MSREKGPATAMPPLRAPRSQRTLAGSLGCTGCPPLATASCRAMSGDMSRQEARRAYREQAGSQLKGVDPVARADQVHAVPLQEVFVDLAQVAHRAGEAIQLGHGDGIDP